jgi:hypothetical protein
MMLQLPPLYAAFVAAKNAHDSKALAALFAADAVVADEGEEITGIPAIEAWSDKAKKKYALVVEPTAFTPGDPEDVLTAIVSGTFDGSPLEFRFFFKTAGGKITALRSET